MLGMVGAAHGPKPSQPAPCLRLAIPTAPCLLVCTATSPYAPPATRAVLQEPRLRRLHVRTAMPIKMDPERPEYHRAVATWARPGEHPPPEARPSASLVFLAAIPAAERTKQGGQRQRWEGRCNVGWTAGPAPGEGSSCLCSCAHALRPYSRCRGRCARRRVRRAGSGQHRRADQQPPAVAAVGQRAAGDPAGKGGVARTPGGRQWWGFEEQDVQAPPHPCQDDALWTGCATAARLSLPAQQRRWVVPPSSCVLALPPACRPAACCPQARSCLRC